MQLSVAKDIKAVATAGLFALLLIASSWLSIAYADTNVPPGSNPPPSSYTYQGPSSISVFDATTNTFKDVHFDPAQMSFVDSSGNRVPNAYQYDAASQTFTALTTNISPSGVITPTSDPTRMLVYDEATGQYEQVVYYNSPVSGGASGWFRAPSGSYTGSPYNSSTQVDLNRPGLQTRFNSNGTAAGTGGSGDGSSSGGLSTDLDLSGVNAQSMLQRIAEQIPSLTKLATAIAYVMGMIFIIRGVILLKHQGEMRTQMSHEHHIARPLTLLAIGSLLLYLPTTVQVGMSTFWVDPSPYAYKTQMAGDQWMQFMGVCFSVIQFIGILAFIRGLVILGNIGHHGGHQGRLGQGITHIIGGIMCINIYQFVQVVFSTIGVELH